MISKKVCMLGGFSVGKTSLVARFVRSMFSEKYQTTIGVKIDRKTVPVAGDDVDMVLWDIYGEDDFQKIRLSYLRGAAGYVLVVDGTRAETLQTALAVHESAVATLGSVPFVLLLNKADLAPRWELDLSVIEGLQQAGWHVVRTSAKTGDGVENAFTWLAGALVANTSR
jgi:small GTP-binding protein